MRSLTLGLAALLAVGLATQVAQAFPSRAGNCSYCHAAAAGQLDITGNQTEETVGTNTYKTFVVEPGGSTQFAITAVTIGVEGGEYAIVLNRLDLLNETIQYSPKLYTSDPDWLSASTRTGALYLGGQGRYYATPTSTTAPPQTYVFDLILSSLVKPGFYTIEARMAGGNPETDGWQVLKTFGLRVIPEPASAALLMLGFVPLFTRRFGR